MNPDAWEPTHHDIKRWQFENSDYRMRYFGDKSIHHQKVKILTWSERRGFKELQLPPNYKEFLNDDNRQS